MSQLALARRYRPRTFETVVGQEITVRALSNALALKRLHHAYLFTGTRGVGKTSIARILAKCLNCERGISATPCGECVACQEIDAGRFVDLIEVDAASRTKVEDTRELLDNVQYLPTRGRFKIYLIDEVHMLSGHSFNALLKTLEEPPAHVKFLLATTDPQKLPATVLSRCLQFHLWRVSVEKIAAHLGNILHQENISVEPEALQELSRAADGSVRDALSLLDQALNYSPGVVEAQSVRAMLGLSEKGRLLALLTALANADGRGLLREIQVLAEKAPDFFGLLTEVLELIHWIAVAQCAPEALEETQPNREAILAFAKAFSPEEIQLYYQIGLQGQRDLSFAPNPKMGFEMLLLRMLAFQPVRVSSFVAKTESTQAVVEFAPVVESHIPESAESIDWHAMIQTLNLESMTRVLAENCVLAEWSVDRVRLILDSAQKQFLDKGYKRYRDRLQEALSQYLKSAVRLEIIESQTILETPAANTKRLKIETQAATTQMVQTDTQIQGFMKTFDASIEQISIPTE